MAGVVDEDGDGRTVVAVDAQDTDRRIHGSVGHLFPVTPEHGDAPVRIHAPAVVADSGVSVGGADPRRLERPFGPLYRMQDLFKHLFLPFRRPAARIGIEDVGSRMGVGGTDEQAVDPGGLERGGPHPRQPSLVERAAQVERHQGHPLFSRLEHEDPGEEGIERSRGDLVLRDAVVITVHLESGRRRDVNLGPAGLERGGVEVRRQEGAEHPKQGSPLRPVVRAAISHGLTSSGVDFSRPSIS